MKRNSLIIALFTLCISFSLHTVAQTNIWINGYTYTEEQGKQIMVPFATISVYDYPKTDELKYFTMSGTKGNYSIRPYDYKKQYHFVVEAAGYKSKEFNLKEIPEMNNGKVFSGNCTVHILLEKASPIDKADSTKLITYNREELEKKGETKSVPDLLNAIPGIRKEGNDWITSKDEGSVCLLLNGTILTAQMLSKFYELPMSVVSAIEYYQLPKGGIYEAAINIVLSAGKQASAPDYILKQNDLIF